MLKELFKKAYAPIHEKIFSYRAVRLEPSDWVEKNVYLSSESRKTGLFEYSYSPYTREIIDNLSPTSPVEMCAVMKCSQSGFTQGVVVGILAWIISELPMPTMFFSGTVDLVKNTITKRLDPVIFNSGLQHLLKTNVQKKRNNKSGDTDFNKEFAGGSIVCGTYAASNLRFHSARVVIADEFDAAPRSDKKEGSTRLLLEGRTKSFGSTKKICYISTPTVKGQSNVEDVYLDGDQRKWHWKCPDCREYIPILWSVKREDDTFGGIKYLLNDSNELIEESVHYECQICGCRIDYKDKYSLNLTGKWIPTAKPKDKNYRSYQLNSLVLPPGFSSWVDLVKMWLECCPPNEPINFEKLKSFKNTELGETWEDLGTTPRSNELMMNIRGSYNVGVIPDVLCGQDDNGKIALITMAVDLGGIMDANNEDVRVDWEIVAHTTTGVTYRIEHGSIGTFKRSRQRNKSDVAKEQSRIKYTYTHGLQNSVWPFLRKIIEKPYPGQSGDFHDIDITVIDTGFFSRSAYTFIESFKDRVVVGTKGYPDADYRKLNRDTPVIKRSVEQLGKLYILQVNQLKDMLAQNMTLKTGMDGYQPSGFMNFPQPQDGLFTFKSYFVHYEGEHRIEEEKNGVVVGFTWKKKNSNVENHFFDTAVYTIAAREIYIDIIRRSHAQNKNLTWDIYCEAISKM